MKTSAFRLLALLLAALLCFSMVGCGGGGETADNSEEAGSGDALDDLGGDIAFDGTVGTGSDGGGTGAGTT